MIVTVLLVYSRSLFETHRVHGPLRYWFARSHRCRAASYSGRLASPSPETRDRAPPDVPGKTAAVSPAEQYQHGNAPRRGRSPRGLRVVLPRSAARQRRCGARDDPGGENAGAHSACVGNRRSHVQNNSGAGEPIYDPSLGGGTTLIAAETIGRVCLGVELEPRFVDVAIRRWEAFSGEEATLLSDGQTFKTVARDRHSSAKG
jgi:hypothetical protein